MKLLVLDSYSKGCCMSQNGTGLSVYTRFPALKYDPQPAEGGF